MRHVGAAILIVVVGWFNPPVVGQQPESGPGPHVPDSIVLLGDVVYSRAPGANGRMIELKLDAASPKQSQDTLLPAVIFVHGGGFRGGSKDAGLPLVIAFAQGGYLAVTIDYRLSGVAGFPAAVHDCKAAVRFLRANAEELGIDPWRIGIVGPSAGGHLSALIGTSGNDGALEGELEPSGVSSAVQCVVDIAGPVDFTRFNDELRRDVILPWLGQKPEVFEQNAKAASPLTYVDDADPPFLLIHGTADSQVPIMHSELLKTALEQAEVSVTYHPVEGAGHAIPPDEVMPVLASFLDDHLGGRAAAVFRKRLDQRPEPTDAPTLPMKGDR